MLPKPLPAMPQSHWRKQAYGFLRFATQEKMYNYVQVSREKWGYVDKRRTTQMKVALSVDITWPKNNF